MTLAEDLAYQARYVSVRLEEIQRPPFRLPFNGLLSHDELRLASQYRLERAFWEEE